MTAIGSLFTGLGGLDLGLELAIPGAAVAWQCDCDKAALRVLATHWPRAHRYSDVREVDESATRVDILCGGFPCQPVSVAGKRRGASDERWLWPEFARVIAAINPPIVFVENVPGLRTLGLRNVLADLAGLGFDAVWDHFWAAEAGAPHRRRRLFLLAYTDGLERWLQQGRRVGKSWQGMPLASHNGAPGVAANATGISWTERRSPRGRQRAGGRPESVSDLPPWVVGDANSGWELQPRRSLGQQWRWARNPDGWSFESPVPGVDDGSAGRLDRERLCGNAVVPQQAAVAFQTLLNAAGAAIARAA